jgi:hypothetical protein
MEKLGIEMMMGINLRGGLIDFDCSFEVVCDLLQGLSDSLVSRKTFS